MLPYNKGLKNNARVLRKRMTGAEQLLWSKVRRRQLKGLQFYRQKTIGNYIVDFYCPKAGIVVELDGGQHYRDDGLVKDKRRDAYLKNVGLKVLRYADSDVFSNLEAVLIQIEDNLP